MYSKNLLYSIVLRLNEAALTKFGGVTAPKVASIISVKIEGNYLWIWPILNFDSLGRLDLWRRSMRSDDKIHIGLLEDLDLGIISSRRNRVGGQVHFDLQGSAGLVLSGSVLYMCVRMCFRGYTLDTGQRTAVRRRKSLLIHRHLQSRIHIHRERW
jgi:hypothetical protein